MAWREPIGLSGLYNAPSSDDGLKSCGKGGGKDERRKDDGCMEGRAVEWMEGGCMYGMTMEV
jgi:hypothetical protein